MGEALCHFSTRSISRGEGRSATAAAAYRAAAIVHDPRTGEVHDYRRKAGVFFTQVLTPDGGKPSLEALWCAAEEAERRKDARTAREYTLAIPSELTEEQGIELAMAFAQVLVDRYGVACQVCGHYPGRQGDKRNRHIHVLSSTRVYQGGGFGEKASLEWSDTRRRKAGLPCVRDEIKALREAWVEAANRALAAAGSTRRMDARAYADRGDAEPIPPTVHIGPAAMAMERRDIRTERGDTCRAALERRAILAELAALKAEEAAEKRSRESLVPFRSDIGLALSRGVEGPRSADAPEDGHLPRSRSSSVSGASQGPSAASTRSRRDQERRRREEEERRKREEEQRREQWVQDEEPPEPQEDEGEWEDRPRMRM